MIEVQTQERTLDLASVPLGKTYSLQFSHQSFRLPTSTSTVIFPCSISKSYSRRAHPVENQLLRYPVAAPADLRDQRNLKKQLEWEIHVNQNAPGVCYVTEHDM